MQGDFGQNRWGTFDAEFQKSFIEKKLKEIDEKIAELLDLKATFVTHLGMGCPSEATASVDDLVRDIEGI